MSQEPAVYGAVPRVSAAGAERLWRQFSALGQAHARRAASAADESRLCFERAQAYRQQIPTPRLAELDAQTQSHIWLNHIPEEKQPA